MRSHDDAPRHRGRPADPRRRRVRRERRPTARLETRIEPKYRGYRFRDDDLAVRLAVEALAAPGSSRGSALGRRGRRERLQRAGLPCVNLANGMTDIHTPDERIAVDDLERMVDVTLALVDAAREAA